jgi:TubC N-terminal docking domain
MNARLLLSDLRGAGVNLTPQGDGLHVDAPAGALTGALRGCLVENKEALIELLERERVGPEAADRRGLVIRWSEYPVWIKLRDPLTGEWHEVRAAECLPGVVESANRKRSPRGAAKNGGAT